MDRVGDGAMTDTLRTPGALVEAGLVEAQRREALERVASRYAIAACLHRRRR